MFLGIEIGGTKLQLGLGPGDGTLAALWRGPVDVPAGGPGIRTQIESAIPELLAQAGITRSDLLAAGIGFGGPVDDSTARTITSHQIEGWDDFPLATWLSDRVGKPVVLGNDADVAGLAEAAFGAGKGCSPVFYVTVGSGIGGGLIIQGRIQRGVGRGAAEIGHLRVWHRDRFVPLEAAASGWGIEQAAQREGESWTAREVGTLASSDPVARRILDQALDHLAEALCHVIALVCPQRIVIGGGVSLLGEELFFEPLRARVDARVFRPFQGLTTIAAAALGEAVVVHGALALARQRVE